MKKNDNFLASLFDAISNTINGAERSILDLISVFVPWLTPITVAYLTYWHVLNEMNFPEWVAWTSAATVEALGIVSVSTAIRFWKNNSMYKNKNERAPLLLAVSTYIFYLLVVLSVNVLLELYTGERALPVVWAIALLSLLSVPSGVLISIRAQYREMLEDRTERREERKQERRGYSPSPTFASDTKQETLDGDNGKFQRGK